MRDASRSSRNGARVAMDAAASGGFTHAGRKRWQRTAKSCGPGAATLASIRPACAGTATVTIKAAHRGEHEVSRKAIARGRPGCLGCTCQTRVHSLLLSAHGAAGAVGARLSLRPLSERGTTRLQDSGKIMPRECGRTSLRCFAMREEHSDDTVTITLMSHLLA